MGSTPLGRWLRTPRAAALLRASALFLALLLLAVGYQKLARYGLPSAKGAGFKDEQTVALVLLALWWGALALPVYLGRLVLVLSLALAVAFSLANWWFFEFYRDFITPGNLKLLIYAREGTLAWDGLSNKVPALVFALSMAGGAALVLRLDRWRPERRAIGLVAAVVLALAAQQQWQYNHRSTGGLAHRGANPIAYFVRALFADAPPAPDARHRDALARLFPDKSSAPAGHGQHLLYRPATTAPAGGNRKNVLLIVLESVRAAESGSYGSDDALTPELDRIAADSVLARNFYANSNQTVRGEVAVLCSAIDYLNGAPYSVGGVPIRTNCLPAMLASAGYTTHWIHGYRRSFFNRGAFFPYLGFQHLHDRATIRAAGYQTEIGWGMADSAVFDYALHALEASAQPFFAEILTLSNHYPYLWDWGIEFPERLDLPADLEQDSEYVYPGYRRGIYYTDSSLGRFWQAFRASPLYASTLVVIVGDHGIWSFARELAGAGGLAAEFERSEKFFRVPLLVHAPDLAPGVLEAPLSQVDIAPSILDYLQLNLANAFLGESFLRRDAQAPSPVRPVFFIAGGSYGFRDGDLRCYPIDSGSACGGAYRKCRDAVESHDARQYCVRTGEDLLLGKRSELAIVDHDLRDSQHLIELTQFWLREGFMPLEAIYNREVFAPAH